LPANRVNHFPEVEVQETPDPAMAPGLEYDKYHITQGLLQKLRDMTLNITGTSRNAAGMDDLIKRHAQESFRDGQLDMIRMLSLLAITQENQ
jgi:hypothetical protein